MRYAAYFKQVNAMQGRLFIRDNKTGKEHKCVWMRGAGQPYLWAEELHYPATLGIPREKDTIEALADRIASWLNDNAPVG